MVEQSSGNVFEDLGLPKPEEHLVKAELVQQIALALKRRKIKPIDAADRLRLPSDELCSLLRGVFHDYSLEQLFGFLIALDQDIEIIVKPKPRSLRRRPRLNVRAA